MSSKNKGTVAPEATTGFRSVKDAGLIISRAFDKLGSMVRNLILIIPGLGTEEVDQGKLEELKDGIGMHWLEAKASQYSRTYRKEGQDTYIPDPQGSFELTAEYALGFTQYEFGRLPPNLKEMCRTVRVAQSQYVSNRIGDIRKAAAKALAEDAAAAAGGEKAPARRQSSFNVWLDEMLKAVMLKRYASAAKRGEPNLPDAKALENAIKAFNAALKRS